MLQKLEGAQVEQMLLGPRRPFWKIDPYSRDLFDNFSIHINLLELLWPICSRGQVRTTSKKVI